jgi:hypothetical protein
VTLAQKPSWGARALLVAFSLLFAALLGEAALRIWYRDAGRRTLNGPGGLQFEHDTIDGELRGRRDVGPKRPGLRRIMVIGDSITYGLGVRDWRQTWPELVAQRLEAAGQGHEMAVFAFPGQDIVQHVQVMREWAARVAPDVLLYQWYVNDIEAISHRPDFTRVWQRLPWHGWLRRTSYAYFVLDHRIAQLLPPPGRSYVDYLLTDFAPGTMEWAEFERQFHEFAVTAASVASRRVMMLYPQVPYGDRYPLRPLHDRMQTLAGAHDLLIPPAAWVRAGGPLVADSQSPWRNVFAFTSATPEAAVETFEYVFPAGALAVDLLVRFRDDDFSGSAVGVVQLLAADTGQVVHEAEIQHSSRVEAFEAQRVHLTVPGSGLQRVRLRVRGLGTSAWWLGDIRIPVDYGFEVLDLAAPLNEIATHASPFDAHPNEAAQRVMADHVFAALTAR